MTDNSSIEARRILDDALAFGIDPSLDEITKLMLELGDPQNSFASIQVAGTNGKTSTARLIAGLLHVHGLTVGLYTSPELIDREERIEVDQHCITQEEFAEVIISVNNRVSELIESGVLAFITEFELLTAAALLYFAQQKVDVAVLEVGLGGRWDATSVVDPSVAVITSIGLDHTALRGTTLEKIAAEKAAIIKPGCAVVLGAGTSSTSEVFKRRIAEVSARQQELPSSLPASLLKQFPLYQNPNICCAVAAAEAFLRERFDASLIEPALLATPLPGRFEILCDRPLLLIDAAHNPAAAAQLAKDLTSYFNVRDKTSTGSKIPASLLLGVLADKDIDGIINDLCPLFDSVAVTKSSSARAYPVQELAKHVRERFDGPINSYETVKQALEALRALQTDVVATGSITIAGEVKRLISQKEVFW